MTKIIVLSGGLDSTAAAVVAGAHAAISFDYGQRHSRELVSAVMIAERLGIPHRIVNIDGLLAGGALTGESEVPEGHYADDNMAATVVPGRNLLFASIAIASARPGDSIILGVHAGDHPVYPDCRPEFWAATRYAAEEGYDVSIETPFIAVDKAELIRQGTELDAPLELTWSCYVGGDTHCGRCGTCVERAEAFDLAGVPDPTTYVDSEFWREVTR